jgi:enediyne biosynthesis protein E4
MKTHGGRVAVKRVASGSLAIVLAFGIAVAQVSDPDAVKRRALALAQGGDFGQARADLERLVSERPDDRLARKLLARVLIAASATADAEAHLRHLVRTDANDAEAWSLLGRMHQDAQRFDIAAGALERAVRLDASDVAALTALANAYVGLGRIEMADVTFARAIRANSRRGKPAAEPHASYAVFLLRANRPKEAETEARRAAAIDPAHPLVKDALRALERRSAVTTQPAIGETRPAPRFADIAVDAGVDFTLRNSPTPEKHQIETMPGGVAVLDYDQDGLIDIYFTNGAKSPSLQRSGPDNWNRLYKNLGNGRFADVTEHAGVQGDGYMMGAAAADFDNDGFPDLFVAGVGHNILYRNLGNGTFRDVTADARLSSTHPTYGPMWSIHGAWLDFDRDGWLDLFIVNYCRWDPDREPYCGEKAPGLRTYCHPRHYAPLPNQLFRNNRDGTFRDVSMDSNVGGHLGKGMGAAVGDVDDDRWPDVFVANDTEPNFLFRNRGDGTFEDVASAWGVSVNQFGSPVSAMGADLRDIDNDGRVDLFVTDLSSEGFLLYRHAGTHFEDASDMSGITFATLPYAGWSNPVADYNNDGWKDLFSANGHVSDAVESIQGRSYRQGNLLLLNRGNGTFRDASSEAGDLKKPGAHRGAAVADLDNDGRLDLVVTVLGDRAKLLRNASTSSGQWLMLRLVGRARPEFRREASNRDGLGTVVRATLDDGRVLVNHATTSVGFASSSDPRVHIGVPPNRRVTNVTLRWPSGVLQTIEHPALNQIMTIEESGINSQPPTPNSQSTHRRSTLRTLGIGSWQLGIVEPRFSVAR